MRVNRNIQLTIVDVVNNPLRFVDPLGYQAQNPKDDKVDRVIININDAEQQRRLQEEQTAKNWLDLPLIPTGACITGNCGGVSVGQVAKGYLAGLAFHAESMRIKAQALIPDGVQVNATALWLISVDATITPDFDVFGGIDIPILSGWTSALGAATNGGTITPKSGLGASLTGIYIVDPTTRDLNFGARLGDTSAQDTRRSYFSGTAYTAMGCYYACGGLQTSAGKGGFVVGGGTPGTFVGASQSGHLFHIPVEKLPNPFTILRKNFGNSP